MDRNYDGGIVRRSGVLYAGRGESGDSVGVGAIEGGRRRDKQVANVGHLALSTSRL